MKLTVEQTQLLFDVTEHHLKWYERYYSSVPEFDVLLELNHIKLKQCFPEDLKFDEEDVTLKLMEFKIDYINMLMHTSDKHKEDKEKKKGK